jgi:putative ABC transport system ATP-binding protein
MLLVEDLQFNYAGAERIVDIPRYEIDSGKTGLLVGRSGSGKSTVLALIAGLLTPKRGRIEIGGQDIAALKGSARDRFRGAAIGLVPQRLLLSPALTVMQNLQLAPYALGRAALPARAHELLSALGIAELAHKNAAQISGGQAQRVAVARALMNAPQVVLADEPTANLDDASASQVISLLLSVSAQFNATLLIASHDARVRSALPACAELAL